MKRVHPHQRSLKIVFSAAHTENASFLARGRKAIKSGAYEFRSCIEPHIVASSPVKASGPISGV